MNRRSFVAALAGLPIVGFGARAFGQPKPTEKSGITVHGPELIVVKRLRPAIKRGEMIALPAGYDVFQPSRTLSLRFENVPLWGEWNDGMGAHVSEMHSRLRDLGGVVNRAAWSWRGGTEPAGSLMFTEWGISQQEHGLCSLVCGFTRASGWKPWPRSHRPVDFETEILKALTAGKP